MPAPEGNIPFAAFNIRNKGAVGGDQVKDTAGINAAIAAAKAAGGGTVWVPKGEYLYTNPGQFDALSNIAIRGEGRTSRIRFTTAGARGLYLTAPKNVELRDLVLKWKTPQGRTSSTAGVEFFDGSYAVVEDVEVLNTSDMGIVFNGITRFRCRDAYVHGTAADGIHSVHCTGPGLIESCHVNGTGDDGIALWNYSAPPYVAGAQYGMKVKDNVVENCNPGRGIVAHGCEGFDITGNTVRLAATCGVEAGRDTNFTTLSSKHFRISDNDLIECGSNRGAWGSIQVAVLTGSVRDFSTRSIEDALVVGNRIRRSYVGGLNLSAVKGLLVQGNLVVDPNEGGASGDPFATIVEVRAVDDLALVGNLLRDSRGAPKSNIAIYLDSIAGGAVVGNVMTGMKNPNIERGGVNTRLRITGNNDNKRLAISVDA